MATLPPKFLVLSAGNVDVDVDETEAHAKGMCEVEIEAAVAKIERPLMNLPPRNRARIQMGFVGARSAYKEGGAHEEWEVRQKGWRRQWDFFPVSSSSSSNSSSYGGGGGGAASSAYASTSTTTTTTTTPTSAPAKAPDSATSTSNSLQSPTKVYTWKGSHSVLSHLPASAAATPNCHGNLKLLAPDGTLLAAWKQCRDRRILGNLYVFRRPPEKEASDVMGGGCALPTDVLVVTCLYVVVVERILWTTFFGG
ncbi:uncharacterized protein HMPREF1541_01213 [Cyphellophora europaea CBS 101466]|uniref:Uncharacterized protein n=1 Tax=Cyphellophora europaea (strain CBS 101466) TaxID=1220924 RepID=W2SG96_CYPE1|nr:uncharacterized protein HMPREF1541_01213 [Cyphellophora europaea CBS 101466]ETN47023.1 hypothetical protein HMPREF1541_01213 [Cyphellophora europaea CBS 101466]